MSYAILSVTKLTIDGTKLSFISIALMVFQSFVGSPSKRAMDSMAILTIGGGLGRALTSTKCCFLMPFTAVLILGGEEWEERGKDAVEWPLKLLQLYKYPTVHFINTACTMMLTHYGPRILFYSVHTKTKHRDRMHGSINTTQPCSPTILSFLHGWLDLP